MGKIFCPDLYLAQSVYVTGWWAGSMAAFLPGSVVVFEQQLCYGISGLAQHEAIVPVEVFVVESYLDGFLDKAVHVS
jgi:hypothetical protein